MFFWSMSSNVNGIEGLRFYDFSEMPELSHSGEMI